MEILQVTLSHPPRKLRSPASDAATGLSRALRALGHETMVIVPYHPDYVAEGLLAAKRLSPLVLGEGETVDVLEAQLPSGIHLVLLDVPGVAVPDEAAVPEGAAVPERAAVPDRTTGELPEGGAALASESPGQLTKARAHALGRFARAVAAYVSELANTGRPPDVVHAHDAEAGLCLLALHNARGTSPAKVLSVHDARLAGKADLASADALGISAALATAHAFAMGDQLCLLKGLLGIADRVVVPSQAYARNLSSPERHGGLARAFLAAEPAGIFVGVDVAVYNPATDSALAARYDGADPSPKGVCKVALQTALELDLGAERPLVFVEPGEESEVLALVSALPALVRQDVQLMIGLPRALSTEEQALIAPFRGQVSARKGLSEADRRRFLAAADFYLSLKKHDPAGLRLREAMRYGAVPVAVEVDSAADHVIDCDAQLATGNGFLLEGATQRAVASGIGRCVVAFRSERFDDLRKRVMRRDVSWDRPSRQVLQLYGKLVTRRS